MLMDKGGDPCLTNALNETVFHFCARHLPEALFHIVRGKDGTMRRDVETHSSCLPRLNSYNSKQGHTALQLLFLTVTHQPNLLNVGASTHLFLLSLFRAHNP